MADALGEHGPVPDRDHGDEGEGEQAQDPAQRNAPEQASRGESYGSHIRRGSRRRDNGGLRRRGRRLTAGLRTDAALVGFVGLVEFVELFVTDTVDLNIA
jgi:hypothetical protein